MPKFSVKKPFVILVGVIICLILGGVSFSKLTTDLLPKMNMPYLLVVTTYAGASPEKVKVDVTEPIENKVGTVNGVKKVSSVSAENASQIFLEFEDDTNMDAAMVKVTSAMNQLDFPDGVGNPMIMEISMDMVATITASIDCDGKEGVELSKFIEDNIIPEIERQDGVASVNTTGMLEESVEVVLNQDKIDEVNKKILEKTDSTLAKAKRKIDKAQKKLEDGKAKLEEQQDKLSDTQDTQADEMAKFTKLMNQALATQAAYDANLATLKASQTALTMEKKAYQKNKIVSSYNQMNQAFAMAQKSFDEGEAGYTAIYEAVYQQVLIGTVQAGMTNMGMDVTVTAENVEEYLKQFGDSAETMKDAAKQQATELSKTQTKTQKTALPTDVKDAIDHPAKLTAYTTMLKQQGQSKVAKQFTKKNLRTLYDIVNTRMPQIETELANLKIEISTAEAVVLQVGKQISKATENYEKVEAGKMTAAAAFGSGTAQMAAAKTAMEDGEKELKEAKKSFEKSRDTALENANLDQLLTMDTLSGILAAENFSMPAGYISQDETQYLVKVGDQYDSVEAMEDTLLVKMKGVGSVRLKDVADITIVDNSKETYAKLNGKDAVLLSISKSSTAGTSTVSKDCNKKMEELEKEYEGLHFTNLMDQGDYIKIIVDSVLSNLLWGALLAIIVLFLFLRDVRPTVVVAFSIPLSVLFAVVLMYFTNITLNIISLSGLALGIGMLVDNSIVVIENIYRLRNSGMSAAKAAVKGANQVAGAIFSSTLTTICVFLPIVFTDGITRSIMQDMCLTIAYSLTASLIVALTVVPSMGSTLLKNTKERKHRFFDALVNAYEKILRFCLKAKFVPILVAVFLLIFSIWKVVNMGIVFMPEMGSEQLSFTYETPQDTSTEEDLELADQIGKQVQQIKGVDMVGAMMGDDAAIMLGSSGASKNFSVMVLLKPEYSNENKKIAKKIEEILEEKELEDFTVASSNMDMSAMMGDGLQINIYGKDMEKIEKISNDVMKMVEDTGKFEEVSNGLEEGDKEIVLTVDKDKAMKYNLTVAQIFQELAAKLKTDKEATSITVNEQQYDVVIVDERDELDVDNLMDYTFETTKTNDKGETETENHKLKEFATMSEGTSLASLNRENLSNYMSVTGVTKEGENVTLISRDLKKEIKKYDVPDGYDIEIAGESENTEEMMNSMLQMIALAIALIYLIMVAQFQGLLSPFIVLLTLPLAFTGGLIAMLLAGEELSVMSMMGFLVLSGVVVNNGIVFVDYVNQLRMDGMEKKDALVETGKTRMRPILMTALTTILAMSTMALSQDTSAAMSRGMAIVTIGGLAYATLMTLFIVPVFYDIFYRRKEMKRIDLGEEDE